MKNSKRILSVTIKRMMDESPDTSWGEYSDRATSEFSIDRASNEFCGDIDAGHDWLERIESRIMETREDIELDSSEDIPLRDAVNTIEDLLVEYFDSDNWDRREFRYFNPSFNYVDKSGKALPENTPEEVRDYTRQDYKRMERLNAGDWCFIGIRAEAQIALQCNAHHANVQHITSGGLWGIESDSDDDYLESVEKDELSDLKGQLLALGFSKRAIATAFKNVERKDS